MSRVAEPESKRGVSQVRRVAVVGLGLIGGSLALALNQGGVVAEVVGYDRDPAAMAAAQELGAISRGATTLAEVGAAEVVFLGVPVDAMVEVVGRLAPHLRPGCVLTDVGSTKGALVTRLERALPPGCGYVGGHPMTGSERSGLAAADRYLFENVVYLLTPTGGTNPGALAKVRALVEAIGAKVMTLSPEEHDLLVAGVSHLPHLIAAALVNAVGRLAPDHPQIWRLAAGGFRDTTRVAGGNPALWRAICLSNRESLATVLAAFRESLAALEEALAAGDGATLERELATAVKLRQEIPPGLKGFLPGIFELVATVPDRPGSLAALTSALGRAGVNIADIEIMRVREGEGGSIRLAFQSEQALTSAMEVLSGEGFAVRRR